MELSYQGTLSKMGYFFIRDILMQYKDPDGLILIDFKDLYLSGEHKGFNKVERSYTINWDEYIEISLEDFQTLIRSLCLRQYNLDIIIFKKGQLFGNFHQLDPIINFLKIPNKKFKLSNCTQFLLDK